VIFTGTPAGSASAGTRSAGSPPAMSWSATSGDWRAAAALRRRARFV